MAVQRGLIENLLELGMRWFWKKCLVAAVAVITSVRGVPQECEPRHPLPCDTSGQQKVPVSS